MAAYHRVDDLRSPAGWLPVHRDQLRAQRSVSSMGSLYLYLFTSYVRFKKWRTYARAVPIATQHAHRYEAPLIGRRFIALYISVLSDWLTATWRYLVGRTKNTHNNAPVMRRESIAQTSFSLDETALCIHYVRLSVYPLLVCHPRIKSHIKLKFCAEGSISRSGGQRSIGHEA